MRKIDRQLLAAAKKGDIAGILDLLSQGVNIRGCLLKIFPYFSV